MKICRGVKKHRIWHILKVQRDWEAESICETFLSTGSILARSRQVWTMGFLDFKNLTFTTNFAVPSRSHGALFITDTWGVEDCLYDWGCDDIITVQLKNYKQQRISLPWWSQKQGRPERAPSNMSSIPTRRRKGSENCGHLAEPGSENCPLLLVFQPCS